MPFRPLLRWVYDKDTKRETVPEQNAKELGRMKNSKGIWKQALVGRLMDLLNDEQQVPFHQHYLNFLESLLLG